MPEAIKSSDMGQKATDRAAKRAKKRQRRRLHKRVFADLNDNQKDELLKLCAQKLGLIGPDP